MDLKIDLLLDVPCVRCVLQRNMVSQKRCRPETCEKLTAWLEEMAKPKFHILLKRLGEKIEVAQISFRKV